MASGKERYSSAEVVVYTLYLIATGLAISCVALYVFKLSGDALHPAVVTAPFMMFGYSMWPLVINAEGELADLFEASELTYVGGVYFASVLAMYLGLLKGVNSKAVVSIRSKPSLVKELFSTSFTASTRSRLYILGAALGCLAVLAYLNMLSAVGGLVAAYSRAKGGGFASSGYIGEAVMLSFPAVLLIALSRQGVGIRAKDVMLSLFVCLPHLIQGTLGGRRGPLFLVLSVLVLGWFVARGKRLRMRTILPILLAIGSAVIFVQSQRHHLYLGSGGDVKIENMLDVIAPPKDRLEHNDYVAGVANIITVDYFKDYYWGHRYFVTIFVRPIPRQIWPTKYEDMGATWIYQFQEEEGGQDILEAVGFLLPNGSAVGIVSDIYREFWLGVVPVMFLFGLFLASIWRRHRLRGGLWTILLIEALILTVYLPTQSFSAFFHRYLIMSVATVFVWRIWVRPRRKRLVSSKSDDELFRFLPELQSRGPRR